MLIRAVKKSVDIEENFAFSSPLFLSNRFMVRCTKLQLQNRPINDDRADLNFL